MLNFRAVKQGLMSGGRTCCEWISTAGIRNVRGGGILQKSDFIRGVTVMKTGMNCLKFVAAAALVLSASAALAQPQGFGRGFGRGFATDPTMLLAQEPVQKELELSDDQKSQITKLADAANQARREMRNSGASFEEMGTKMQELTKENKKKVAEILLPPQSERLDQISLQYSLEGGGFNAAGAAVALTQDDLAKKLNITDEQKTKLQEVMTQAGEKMQELGFPPDQDQMAKLRTELKDKALAVLTPEQKDKLEKMKGKKFDTSTIQFGRGGFGRRGGAGGPGN